MSSPSLPHDSARVRAEEDGRTRFSRLAAEWKVQSRYLSDSAQIALLRPYQRIIGMGPPAVPLILEELRRDPDQWFWALEAITGEDPVPAGRVGRPAHGRGLGGMGPRTRAAPPMISRAGFPKLDDQNHRITSPPTPDYNCIAWSAGNTGRWWQPGGSWPVAANRDDYGLGALSEAFRSLGFEECDDGRLEPGYEKVAIYGFTFLFTHAARQLPDGKWTSKLGRGEDIEHDSPDDLAGGLYGDVHQYMRRPFA